MLSYRHAFHAGNHADILKHTVLTLILQSLNQKDKPYTYFDTHAGAGIYHLNSTWAQQTQEAQSGIQRIWEHRSLLHQLKHYFDCILALNETNTPKIYPGSPWLAHSLRRTDDQHILTELHPEDFKHLEQNLSQQANTTILRQDGFQQLIAKTPPLRKRGLVLIDPPYELKQDYVTVHNTLIQAYKRWSTGIYAIWYPLLSQYQYSEDMLRQIAQADYPNLLNIKLLIVDKKNNSGMYGSGMLIINAPWQLDIQMKTLLPILTSVLAQDTRACWSVDWLIAPQ